MPSTSKSKATSLSKSSLKNIIKISIGEKKRRRRRRRRRTRSATTQQQQQDAQQQPQVVVVNQTPPDPYKREASVQESAFEKNFENMVKTKQAEGRRLLGGGGGHSRLVAPQTELADQAQQTNNNKSKSLLNRSIGFFQGLGGRRGPPATADRPTQAPAPYNPAQAVVAPTGRGGRGRSTLDLANLSPIDRGPLQSPDESNLVDDAFWRPPPTATVETQTDLSPDRRLEFPPLASDATPPSSPFSTAVQGFEQMRQFVLSVPSKYWSKKPSLARRYTENDVRSWTADKNMGAMVTLYKHVKNSLEEEKSNK